MNIPLGDPKLSENQIDVKETIIILEFNISIVEGLAKNMYVFIQMCIPLLFFPGVAERNVARHGIDESTNCYIVRGGAVAEK